MGYILDDLEYYNDRIEEIAKESGLDYYTQEFEIINYNDMIAYEAYTGMPSRYPHWSFGKAFEKIRTLYRYNLTGLAYEMVINSDPCVAYLMKDNTLLLQILTIAHVYAHNDFFKNNRMFREGTDAKYTIEMFKNNANIISGYINDPSIGYENVERVLNAAHAIKLQISRTVGGSKISDDDLKKRILDDYKDSSTNHSVLEPRIETKLPDVNKIPLEPQEDLLLFITQYGDLSEWEKNIVEIVRKEALYFIPQIETKIMNEGWASYWHYNILKKLELPPSLHLEFIKRHNDVVRPVEGSLNPYYLGFEIYNDLVEKYGEGKIFEVREIERDQSFLRRYLTKELCEKLNLFQYGKKDKDYLIQEISDEEGWKKIRDTLSNSSGMGSVPMIRVIDMSKRDKALTLEHVYDGRELNSAYAEGTLKHMMDLWGHRLILKTNANSKVISIICDENKKISYI